MPDADQHEDGNEHGGEGGDTVQRDNTNFNQRQRAQFLLLVLATLLVALNNAGAQKGGLDIARVVAQAAVRNGQFPTFVEITMTSEMSAGKADDKTNPVADKKTNPMAHAEVGGIVRIKIEYCKDCTDNGSAGRFSGGTSSAGKNADRPSMRGTPAPDFLDVCFNAADGVNRHSHGDAPDDILSAGVEAHHWARCVTSVANGGTGTAASVGKVLDDLDYPDSITRDEASAYWASRHS